MDKLVKPTVLKLGGSVITFKGEEHTPNIEAVERLAGEIAESGAGPLILVHGGGSFGHPVAEEYRIFEGYREPAQRIGFAKTRQAMMALNKIVIDAFIGFNMPVVSVQPSAFIMTESGRIKRFDFNPVQKLLRLGFIPVMYGDAVLDLETGFTILSGDQLAAELAVFFNAEKIVITVDVDGLFTEDPKINPGAELLEDVSLEELKQLLGGVGGAKTVDVTGGMRGKIDELIPALEHGIRVEIVNALKEGRIYKALKGERVIGTRIKPW